MPKLLTTIRFDDSDKNVFVSAASEGEWAISAAFQFCDMQWDDLDGKPKQAFRNGILGLSSFGYSTFASVTTITSSQLDKVQLRLAKYLIEDFGAPSLKDAMSAANEELAYICELCEELTPGKVLAVRREFNPDGKISESFHLVETVEDEGEQCVHHDDIWEIVDD